MKTPCTACSLEHLHHGLSGCAQCGAMVWSQSADPAMGFHGFEISWSAAQLEAARSGAARPLGQRMLSAQIPGGWTLSSLHAVMAALIPRASIWRAVLPQLTPADADEGFMLQQMAEVLTRPEA